MLFEIKTEDDDKPLEFPFTVRQCVVLIPLAIFACVGSGLLAGWVLVEIVNLIPIG